jgi:hypothetical protein
MCSLSVEESSQILHQDAVPAECMVDGTSVLDVVGPRVSTIQANESLHGSASGFFANLSFGLIDGGARKLPLSHLAGCFINDGRSAGNGQGTDEE